MDKIFSVFLLVVLVKSWDLKPFGISDNYYISSIAIYRARTFLTLPRSVCHNSINNPTVVEVPWTSGYAHIVTNHVRYKVLDYQKWKDCKDIQDAVSLDIEPINPKLWILDKGNEYCEAKLLSYNVIFNSISEISELRNIPRKDLSAIAIDPKIRDFEYRIYVGNTGENTLLVFLTKSLKWWKLNLIATSSLPVPINADYLAISKTEPILYITGKESLELFSINLDNNGNFEESSSYESEEETDLFRNMNVTFIGRKMGISSGIETDYKSGLNYYMIRDYVVVRWLTGLPMSAEYHSVLIQSFKQLPYVSDLFTDPQYSLWALVNPLSLEDCHEVNNTIQENIPRLETRVVKILKYNKLLDEMF